MLQKILKITVYLRKCYLLTQPQASNTACVNHPLDMVEVISLPHGIHIFFQEQLERLSLFQVLKWKLYEMKFLVNNNYFVICKTLKRPTEKKYKFLKWHNLLSLFNLYFECKTKSQKHADQSFSILSKVSKSVLTWPMIPLQKILFFENSNPRSLFSLLINANTILHKNELCFGHETPTLTTRPGTDVINSF